MTTPITSTVDQNWAFSSKALAFLEAYIIKEGHRHIIECGSGDSTVMLADLSDRGLINDWLSLEHDHEYAKKTWAMVPGQHEHIKHCPLVETAEGCWYNPEVYAKQLAMMQPVTLVIVDGPPYTTGTHARYPAVPLLLPALAPGAVIILDDSNRPDEQEVIERWQNEHGLRLVQHFDTANGLSLFKLSV